MRIDLSCPVELWRYELPTAEYPYCLLLLFNLSDKAVNSLQVTLISYNEAGEVMTRHVERLQGLTGAPRNTFEAAVPCPEDAPPITMELLIEKVWFDDNSIWRRSAQPLTEYEPNTLPNNRRLEMLRFVAGQDVVGYPSDQGSVWVCVCGRANSIRDEACARCRRDRKMIFDGCNQQTIEAMVQMREQELDAVAKKAREDASQLQQQREQETAVKQKKKKRFTAILTAVLGVAAVACAVIFLGVPFLNYQTAKNELNAGNYEEARQAFASMGAYQDAEAMIKESDYQEAKAALALNTQAGFEKAIPLLDTLGDYLDSAALAQQARYDQAKQAMELTDYETAIARFGEVLNFQDAKSLQMEAQYLRAKELIGLNNYEAAREMLLVLGEYQDAPDLAAECLYVPGIAALNNQEYEAAIKRLSLITDYKDAAVKLKQAYYENGKALMAEENYTDAGVQFELAGDYEDSAAMVTRCIIEPAKSYMLGGEYDQAIALLTALPDNADAKAIHDQSVYLKAKGMIDSQQFDEAYALLATIPEYEGIQALITEGTYAQGKNALDAGNNTAAIAAFEKITDYSDATTLLQKAQYAAAQQAVANADYETAITLYAALGSYQGSAKSLREVSYQRAKELLADGSDTQRAIALLQQADGYQDSEKLLNQAVYQYAGTLRDSGDAQGAAEVYESLGKYEDAAAQAISCRVTIAQRAYNGGDYATVIDQLAAHTTDKAALVLYQQAVYAQAAVELSAGNGARAGALLTDISGYQDADSLAEKAFDDYYAAPYQAAAAAYDIKDYQAVANALVGLNMADIPAKYKSLTSIYNDSLYRLANQLYADDKPYEALPYYQLIAGYKNVSSELLVRNCYKILGSWTNASGDTMTFNRDGTCVINGEHFYFTVKLYSMRTSATADGELTLTHKVSSLNDRTLTLRDTRGKTDVVYKMTRVQETTELDVSADVPDTAAQSDTVSEPEQTAATDGGDAPEETAVPPVTTPPDAA